VKAAVASLMLLAMSALAETSAGAMNAVAARWLSSSRLTPIEAAKVLYLEASGAAVSDEDLFEAEKHLRSDGPVSPNEYVLREVFTRLLRSELGASELRIERPLLHWLESRVSPRGVELRGESLQLAVLYEHRSAVVRLRHRTIHHQWENCGATLCLSTLPGLLRSEIRYLWANGAGGVSPGCRTAPPPLVPDDTNDLSCVFVAGPRSVLRITYAAAGKIALAPANAAASAVVNNPLELRLFD